jgi:hypothetical protein
VTGMDLAGPATVEAGSAPDRAGRAATGTPARARLSWRAELVTMLLAGWLMIGLFVDGWAHSNLAALETFFTPWHALFYSGFIATALWIIWQVDRRYRAGKRGLEAVPAGYALALVGVGVFALGGVGDMGWHTIFGIETNIDALFSPTHLLLFIGIVLITSAPLRGAWSDASEPAAPGFRRFLPILLSATLTATLVAFMFMFLGAFVDGAGNAQVLERAARSEPIYLLISDGVSGVQATNLIVLAPLLLLMRRWRIPFGSATVLLVTVAALTNAISAYQEWWLIVAAALGGVGVDLLLSRLRPWEGQRRFWAAGALIPLVIWSFYFATVAIAGGIGWVVELWTGSIMWAGLLGTALALLMHPPAPPQRTPDRVEP